MFNLTSFWVRDNCISLFEDRNLENYELFVELSTTSSMTDAFCLAGTALVLLQAGKRKLEMQSVGRMTTTTNVKLFVRNTVFRNAVF